MNENILILLVLSIVYLLWLFKVANTPGRTPVLMMWLLVGTYALILIKLVSMVLEALRP